MADEPSDVTVTDLSGTRWQAVQRLQIGVFGLAAMILLIGVANIFIDRARQVEAGVVPAAAATVAADETPAAVNDPLADAGVVPELPELPEPRPSLEPDTPPANAP